MRSFRNVAAPVAALALLLASCGDDDGATVRDITEGSDDDGTASDGVSGSTSESGSSGERGSEADLTTTIVELEDDASDDDKGDSDTPGVDDTTGTSLD